MKESWDYLMRRNMKVMLYVIDSNKKTKFFIYFKMKIEIFCFKEIDGR